MASTAAAATVADASSTVAPAASSAAADVAADAAFTAADATVQAIGAIASQSTSVLGRFPDYSITVATSEGAGWVDRFLHLFQLPVEILHDSAGLPWWGAIVAASVAMRTATTYVFLKSVRSGANLQEHMEALQALQRQVQEAVGDQNRAQAVAAMRDYYKAHKINPLLPMVPLLQIPVMLGAFWALQRFAREAHLVPGFMEGGAAWFHALHLADPSFVLPTLSTALTIASVWANPNVTGIPQAELTPMGMRYMFTFLGGLFSTFTYTFPVAVQLYLCVTGVSVFGQQLLLRSRAVRARFDFPAGWPPSAEVTARRQKTTLSALKSFAPVFRRFSAAAAGEWGRALSGAPAVATQTYLSQWAGLRDPGPPPPPAEAPIGLLADAASPAALAAATQAVHAALPAAAAAGTVAGAAATAPAPAGTAAAARSVPVLSASPPRKPKNKRGV